MSSVMNTRLSLRCGQCKPTSQSLTYACVVTRTDRISGYVISQIPSQIICTRGMEMEPHKGMCEISFVCETNGEDIVRLSIWCPSWELFWVIVTFATAAVKTPYHLYGCRFLVSLLGQIIMQIDLSDWP